MSGDEQSSVRTEDPAGELPQDRGLWLSRFPHYLFRGVLSAGALACAGLVMLMLSAVAAPLPDRGLVLAAPAADIAAPAALPDIPEPAAVPIPAATGQPAAGQPAPGQPAEQAQQPAPAQPPVSREEAFAAWASRMSAAVGISPRALQAYANAHAILANTRPGCHLTWVTLAGIATVESGNATYGGRTLLPSGLPSSPIIGIPLNGAPAVRAIADTDNGILDGDKIWDRAVGPFQFIPSTWAAWRADGNGDGRTDPQNIDDAALAAGNYLCAGGGNLNSGNNWVRAVLSYNNSIPYAELVYGFAQNYARRAQGVR